MLTTTGRDTWGEAIEGWLHVRVAITGDNLVWSDTYLFMQIFIIHRKRFNCISTVTSTCTRSLSMEKWQGIGCRWLPVNFQRKILIAVPSLARVFASREFICTRATHCMETEKRRRAEAECKERNKRNSEKDLSHKKNRAI